MTPPGVSWRQAARSAIGGSLVVRTLAGAARRVRAVAAITVAQVTVPVSWLLAPTAASDDLILDRGTLRAMIGDGWLVRRGHSLVSAVSGRLQSSATAGFWGMLRRDVDILTAAERVRVIGAGIAAALATHAALTRFDLLVGRSPWLAGWLVVLLVAVALLRHPAAIAAAWSNRTR